MNDINNIISESVESINKQLPKDKNISKEEDFEILGKNSNFDSMALINFVLMIEEKLKKDNSSLNLLNFLIEKMQTTKSYKINELKKDIKKKLDEKRD